MKKSLIIGALISLAVFGQDEKVETHKKNVIIQMKQPSQVKLSPEFAKVGRRAIEPISRAYESRMENKSSLLDALTIHEADIRLSDAEVLITTPGDHLAYQDLMLLNTNLNVKSIVDCVGELKKIFDTQNYARTESCGTHALPPPP